MRNVVYLVMPNFRTTARVAFLTVLLWGQGETTSAIGGSVTDPTGAAIPAACTNPQNCQFGNLGRNALRGPDFAWGDLYLTKWFTPREHVKLRLEGQVFNL